MEKDILNLCSHNQLPCEPCSARFRVVVLMERNRCLAWWNKKNEYGMTDEWFVSAIESGESPGEVKP